MLINNIFSQKSVAIPDFYKYALSNIFSNFRSEFFLCYYVLSSKICKSIQLRSHKYVYSQQNLPISFLSRGLMQLVTDRV